MADLDVDDFLIVEDVDLTDEARLRQIVATIEGLLRPGGRGLRVSVLSAEQWQTVLQRMLPQQHRRGAGYYIHQLKDPRDPQHLLVSPSGVRGINEGVRQIYQEIVYAILRCIPSLLQGPLRKGLDDIVADYCGKAIEMELFARVNPQAAQMVRAMLTACVLDHGYGESDWALLMRREPDKFFLALRKTSFCDQWLKEAWKNQELRKLLEKGDNHRDELISLAREETGMHGPTLTALRKVAGEAI